MCNCFSKNLGLGEAAKRDVGTGANQIPDMSQFPSGKNWFQMPGGNIVQSFSGYVLSADTNGTTINYPISFPDTAYAVSVMWSDASPTTTPTFKLNGNLSDKTKAVIKVTGGAGSFGCLVIAIGR